MAFIESMQREVGAVIRKVTGQGADVCGLADYFPGLGLFPLNVKGCY